MEGENEDAKIDREARTAPNIQTILMKRNEIRKHSNVLNLPTYLVPYLVTNLEAMGAERYMTPLYKLPTDETEALLT